MMMIYLLLILFFTLYKSSESVTTPSVQTVCPTGAIEFEANCFLFKNNTIDFYTAEDGCEGHLVSIHDEIINEFLAEEAGIQLNHIIPTNIWIGFSNLNSQREWHWNDNTAVNFTHWISGEPKNTSERNCAAMLITGTSNDAVWKSFDCRESKPYICKVDRIMSEETSTAAITSSEIPSLCPKGSIEWQTWCLSFNDDIMSFEHAETICNYKKGHLVSIHDTPTNEFLKLQGLNYTDELMRFEYWIGFESIDNDLAFHWLDQSMVDYVNWANGEPKNTPTACVALSTADGKWRNEDCVERKRFICLFGKSEYAATSTSLDTDIPITSTTNASSSSTLSSTVSSTITFNSTLSTDKAKTISKWWYICGSLVVIIVISLIIFYYYWKSRKQKSHQNLEKKFEASPLEARLSTEERQKNYIDKKLIQYDNNDIVGKGANAIVYKAKIKINEKKKFKNTKFQKNCDVALKIPTNFVTTDDVEEFVRELDALIRVGNHPNIVEFHGWTFHQQTPVLITELAHTDLLHFIRNCDDMKFPIKNILSILWQITLALKHIASYSMVHRDVACRNILLTESGAAKLADFGLCCYCDETFTYRASFHKRLPLKWCSIEALIDRLFSEKSDVWSFGVLCYEAFSYGAVPFPTLSDAEMLEALRAGQRLEKPVKASDEIYELMLKCWKEKPGDRPTFVKLSEYLKMLLENETSTYGYLSLGIISDDKKNTYDIVNENE